MEMKKRMEGHLRMLCEKIGARPLNVPLSTYMPVGNSSDLDLVSQNRNMTAWIGEKMEGLLRWKDRISL